MALFYRVVKTDPPTEADFLSLRALGRVLRSGRPDLRRSWEGVSVSSTAAGARETATRHPRTGSFIATVDLGEGVTVPFEQTGLDHPL